MSFLNNLRKTVANMIAPDAVYNPFNEAFMWATGGGYTMYDPKGQTYIDDGYNINPIVYSVINQQAIKTASIPFTVKKVKDQKAAKKYNNYNLSTKGNVTPQQKVLRSMLETKAFEEDDLEFPMERPNSTQTWSEIIALWKTMMLSNGNAYFYMLTPGMGREADLPLQVYLLPSQLIQILLKENTSFLGTESPIKGYMLTYGKNYIEFDAKDVIHVKYSNPNYDENGSHLYGQSRLRAALRNIQSSNDAMRLNIKTLQNGGAFGFIHPKGTQTPALMPEQAAEIKSRLTEMNTSTEDLSKIAGYSVELGFTRLSLTADELKPFDYLKFDEKQICNVLGWDDKLLNNDAGAKYDNVNFARKRVITDNIHPDLMLLAEAFNTQFLPRFKGYDGTVIDFDIMELPEMQTDVTELSKWLNNALDRGVITRNEYRIAISYTTIDEDAMDRLTVTSDVISLDEAIDNDFQTTPKNE